MGYSPQGCKELDMIELLHFTSLHAKFRKGGTHESWPLQALPFIHSFIHSDMHTAHIY